MSDNDVSALLASAPELVNSPGLAASALTGASATGQDAGAAGQAFSYISTLDQAQQHQQATSIQGSRRGFWGSIGHAVAQGFSFAANALNAPLAEVQHQYRYLSDVTERHGIGAGLLSLLPAVAGAAAGGYLGGGEGAVLGGEGAEALVGRLGYRDSWDRTADGAQYRDSAGHLVSPGRDLAGVFDHVVGALTGQHQTGYTGTHWWDKPLSGAGDAVFDLTLDPLMLASKVRQAMKAKALNPFTGLGDSSFTLDEAGNKVLARPGIADVNTPADRMLEIYNNNPGVQKAVAALASASTEDVYNYFPKLAPLAPELGKAKTPDDVLNVFRDALTTNNGRVLSGGLPTTGITRNPIALSTRLNAVLNAGSKTAVDADGNPILSSVAKDADGNPLPLQRPNAAIKMITSYRAFNISDDLKRLSGKEFDPSDASAADTVGQILRISQNQRTANALKAVFADTADHAERVSIYANALRDAMRVAGVPDDSALLTRWLGDAQQMADATANRASYALDRNGNDIVMRGADGQALNSGLFANQTGKLAIPQWEEIRKAATAQPGTWNSIKRIAYSIDDFAYDHFTRPFFKPLALLSLGFAQRVAAGELIPGYIANGADVVRGGLATAAVKLNPSLGGLVSDATDEQLAKLTGVRVHAPGVGDDVEPSRIVSIDRNASTATVANPDGTTTTHPVNDLTAYHNEIGEKDLRLLARQTGLSFDRGEVGHVRAALGKALFQVPRALNDDDYITNAYLNILSNNGHLVAPALAADHGEARVMAGPATVNTALKQIDKKLPLGTRLGAHFGPYGGSADLHPMYWQNAIHEAANDPGIRAGAAAYNSALDLGQTEQEAGHAFLAADRSVIDDNPDVYARRLIGASKDPDQFVANRLAAFQGLTYPHAGMGSGSAYHRFVGDAIAAGDAPSLRALNDVQITDRPMVKGRVLEDVPTEGVTLQRAVNVGFRRVLQPTINMLSREPLFTTLVTKEYKDLQPFIDAGLMSPVDANLVAQQRAVPQMLPLIHNTELRSQAAISLRNLLPFYYAQEQAYRRYGTQILNDPLNFERYRLAVHGLHSSGIIQTDDTGQHYVVLPGAGQVTDWLVNGANAIGLPVLGGVVSQVSGNVSSLKSALPGGLVGVPEPPSVSPLVAIAAKDIQNRFPASEPWISSAIGPVAEAQSFRDAMIPNATLRAILNGTAFSSSSPQFENAYMYALQNAKRRSDELRAAGNSKAADAILPGPDTMDPDGKLMQGALDRIRNTTRVVFFARALFSATSPLAPKLDVGDFGLRQEVRDSIKAAVKAGLGPAVGFQNFLAKHPDATADTVFLTDSTYTGASLTPTSDGTKWIENNLAFVKQYPHAAAFLVPQSGTPDPQGYNLELASGLRRNKTPDEFLRALYSASANAVYYPSLQAKKDAIAANPGAKADIERQFNEYKMQLEAANPVWASDINDPAKRQVAYQTLTELRGLINKGQLPESPQAGAIGALIASYDNFASAERSLAASGQSLSGLNAQWTDFLTQFAKDNPGSDAVVNGIFRRLPAYARYGA